MRFKSEDVYTNTNGEFYRLHYDESQRAYHTEVQRNGEWQPNNSSWYPHFQDACGEFDAVVRIHNLVKKEDKICNTNHPERVNSELSAAEEAPVAIHADVPDAMSTRPDAEPASLAPAFDYSGLDAQTVATLHSAENTIRNARKEYVLKVADAVTMARDELVAKCDKQNNQHSENTFRAWCESVGISKDAAYRLLQVRNLMEASTPNEQKILESAPASLLYAAAKPSSPPELVQQVKSGGITTNKQFQEALEARKAAEAERDAAQERADKAEKEKAEQERQLEASRGLVKMLKEHQGNIHEVELERDAWKQRAEEAESRPVEVAIDESASEKRAQEIAAEYRKEDQETIAQLRAALNDQQRTTEFDTDNFEIGLQFCETFKNAWNLARKACMSLTGEDRYQMCVNIQNIMKKIKGDMSTCQ